MPTNGTTQKMVSAAVWLGAASLGSRIIGLLRERVMTTTFGAGDVFDAFVAAFRLPDLIFNLVVMGALSAAFIPMFTEKLVKSKKGNHTEAFEFALSVLNIVLVAVVVLSAAYVIGAPWIVPVITPGFEGEKLEMTIQLSRIMALQPVLLSVSFMFSGVLNSFKRFVAYALAPIVYNIGIIVGVVWLVPWMGIAGLGWGVVLGAGLHAVVQLPSVLRVGLRWQPVMKWSSRDVKTLRKMIVPRMFGMAGQQMNLFLVTIIGSTLSAGSIAAFHLANNIQSVPVGIFGLAFAQAAFPTLAEQWARKEKKEFRSTLTRTFRYVVFLTVPTAAFAYLLRAQIVRVLFGDGAFDWTDTIMTYSILGLLLVSLFAQAAAPLLIRAFYVRQNTATPVVISLVSMAVNVALAVWLAPMMGVEGLALAFSASAIVTLVLLLGKLHIELNGFDDKAVVISMVRIAVASVLAGMVVQGLKYAISPWVDMTRFWGVSTQMVGALLGGGVAYLGLCMLFKCDELEVLRKYLPRKFKVRLEAGTETPRFGGMLE